MRDHIGRALHQARGAHAEAREDDLLAVGRHAVAEGACQTEDEDERLAVGSVHRRDGPVIEEFIREVARKGDRSARVGNDERRITDGVQARLKGEVLRILVVRRESVGRVDRPDGLQRDAAVQGVRGVPAARHGCDQDRSTDRDTERPSEHALSCLHLSSVSPFQPFALYSAWRRGRQVGTRVQ